MIALFDSLMYSIMSWEMSIAVCNIKGTPCMFPRSLGNVIKDVYNTVLIFSLTSESQLSTSLIQA